MSNAIRFTRVRIENPLGYSFDDQKISELRSCKYLGKILRSELNLMDQVNYIVRKAWKALQFLTRVLKKVNRNTKRLAYTSLVLPMLNVGLHAGTHAEEREMRQTEYRRKLLSLQIIRRILTGIPWLSTGRQHAYVHFLKRSLGNGLGKR